MVRTLARSAALAAVAAVLGLLMAVIPPQLSPEQAHAAIVPYTPPGPVNVLPSTVIGATRGLSVMEAAAVAVIQYAKTPEGAKAIRAYNAGTATPAQLARVNTVKAGYTVPATKAAHLMKGAAPLMSFAVGLQIGQGITRIAGFKDDQVCVEQNGVLEFITAITNGVNCDGYKNALEEAYRNAEEGLGGSSWGESCSPVGFAANSARFCMQLVATYTHPTLNHVGVFKITFLENAVSNAVMNFRYQGSSGGWASTSFTVGRSTDDCGKPRGFYDSVVLDPCRSIYGEGHYGRMSWPDPSVTYQAGNGLSGESSWGEAADETITVANPDRRFRCELQYSDSSIDVFWSDPYTENDVDLAPVKCPPANPSKIVTGTKIIQETDGLPDGLLYEQPTTDEYQQHQALYPECSDGTCLLDLQLIGSEQSCFDNPAACENWFEDPNKSSNYRCMYGTNLVALAECNLYRPTFKPEQVAQGKGYGDPETGATTNVQTTTTADAPAMGQQPSPTAGRQCFPTGWGVLNPVEWVMKPVQCALEWAFVPQRANLGDRWNDFKARVQPHRAAQLILTVGSVFDDIGHNPAGCLGPPMHFDAFGVTETFYPMNACDEPVKGAAATVRAMATFGIVVFTVMAVIRYAGSIFGMVQLGQSSAPTNGNTSRVRFRDGGAE